MQICFELNWLSACTQKSSEQAKAYIVHIVKWTQSQKQTKHKTSPYLQHIRSFFVPRKTEKCSKLELKFIRRNITSNKQQHEHKMFRKITAGKTEKFSVPTPHFDGAKFAKNFEHSNGMFNMVFRHQQVGKRMMKQHGTTSREKECFKQNKLLRMKVSYFKTN